MRYETWKDHQFSFIHHHYNMSLQIQSPLVIKAPTYAMAHDAIDDGENTRVTSTRVRTSDWSIKFQWPVKCNQPQYVFKKKPSSSKVRRFLRFQRNMEFYGIEPKCICQKVWFKGSTEVIRMNICPAMDHINEQRSCVRCQGEVSDDVCGFYVCKMHRNQKK